MSSVLSDVFLEDESLQEREDENYIEMEVLDAVEEARKDNPNMTRMDQIKIACDFCKEKLKNGNEKEQKEGMQQRYLDKLVQLGLERQTIEDEESSSKKNEPILIRGHCFVIQPTRGRNPICEMCMSTIWKLMHSWRRCKYCGLRAHDKCSSEVRRTCAWSEASRPHFSIRTNICQEKGLAAQNYRCAECAHPLAFDGSSALEPRLCDYTGLYFCPTCHWNDMMSIPARMVHNLECDPRPVSRASKQLLTLVDNRPLLPISALNPTLVKLSSSMKRMQKIRDNFLLMKCYFISCKTARSLRILQYLCRHQHFVEGSQLYSMAEIRDLVAGKLVPEMEEIYEVFRKHIEEECETCKGNGFICELCDDNKIIFPFSPCVSMCTKCLAVYHYKCFEHRSRHCPRCERRQKRAPIVFDEVEDV